MTQRRVSVNGRGVYGRAVPLTPPRRRRWGSGVRVSLPARRGIVLGVGALVGLWLVNNWLAVKTISVSGTSTAAEVKRLEESVDKLIGRAWWSRNTLLIDTKQLAQELKQAEPAVSQASIARSLPHTLKVSVQLKNPVMGWVSGNQQFAVGADGVVIGALSAGTTLPVVIDGSNVPVDEGTQVASPDFVKFTTAVVAGLRQRNIPPAALKITETTLDLTVETTRGYRIVFDTGRGVEAELYDLDAVLRVLAAAKRQPAEYIDVRIAGKAYYK